MFGFGKSRKVERLSVTSVWLSACGPNRRHNEDSFHASDRQLAYAVADGIGGGAEGEKASQIVCRELRMMMNAVGMDPVARLRAAERSLTDANAVIHEYARDHGYRQMGSTAAVLVFDPADARQAAVIHVGDSRVYRLRGGLAEPLTRDHSIGYEISDFAGRRAEEFRSRENPLTHMLTRAVGTQPVVKADVRMIDVESGDRFVLCTDGVHDVISNARLAVFASGGTLESAKARLASEVEKAGAPDNYTFVIVEIR